jgi:D-aspartate ligase
MTKGRERSVAFVEGMDVSAYGITRSLGRQGVPVYALNDRRDDALRFSRYCSGTFLYPDDPTQPRTYAGDRVANQEVLCELLLEWSAGFQEKPVLFATSDWFARFLSNCGTRLRERFLFHWSPPDMFSTIVDKGRMTEFCRRAGVRVPLTHITQGGDDIAEVARGFPYPCLVKPIHRYTRGFPVHSGKVFIARSPEELKAFFAEAPQLRGATLIQELIEGEDDQVFQCTALVKSDGEIAAYSTVRKLRQYPAGYGSMCYGRTEPNQEMATEGLKLLRALGYHGFGSLEFKYREKDGGYYFIEMNTRLPWYNGIFADAGVNLAHLAYLDLTGEPTPDPSSVRQRDGTSWSSYQNYSRWYRDSGREMSWGKFAGSLARSKSHAWWNWGDPAPFFGSSFTGVKHAAGNLLRRMHLRK